MRNGVRRERARIAAVLGIMACGGAPDEREEGATLPTTVNATAATTATTADATTADATADASSDAPTTTTDVDTSDPSSTSPATTDPTSATTTDVTTTVEPESESEATTEEFGEPFMLVDPLVDGTVGTAVGGAFGPDGWTVTGNADRVYWALPRLTEGSVEFTMANVTLDNLPLNDHEVFGLYEGGFGIEHPIDYNPEYRVNNYKSMIRIYGQAEPDRVGQQKIMWGMCPHGAPGYTDACPCAGAFFEEPFGGDGSWDGTPQRLRVEWGGGYTRYLRNDAVVLEIDWTQAGVAFGPEELYVSIGTPRPEDVGSASMPIGALFYDVVIEGVTGPAASCM